MTRCCSLAQKPEDAVSSATITSPTAATVVSAAPDTKAEEATETGPWRHAKVVCDYDATNREEMSLMMNEVSYVPSVFILYIYLLFF